MSIVVQEKKQTFNQTIVRTTEERSIASSVLLSALLVSALTSAAVFTAKSMGTLQTTENESMALAVIGASICFAALPFLIAMYKRQPRAAVVAGSVVVFSMTVLAGMIM